MTRKSFLTTLLAGPLALLAGVKAKWLPAPVPKIPTKNWQLAQCLYLFDFPLVYISEQTGIPVAKLKKRIRRKQWQNWSPDMYDIGLDERTFKLTRTPRKFYTAP